jgi:hypothetical protein
MKYQNNHTGDTTRRRLGSRGLTCLLAVLLAASGCKTYTPVSKAGSPQFTRERVAEDLKAGDTVKIITKDGRDLKFKVEQIGAETISGENQSVPFPEIARLEKRKVSAGKTTALGLGVTATVAVILGAIAAGAAAALAAGY